MDEGKEGADNIVFCEDNKDEEYEIFGNLTVNPSRSERMFENIEIPDVPDGSEPGRHPLQSFRMDITKPEILIVTETTEAVEKREEGNPSESSSDILQETQNCEQQIWTEETVENSSDDQLEQKATE